MLDFKISVYSRPSVTRTLMANLDAVSNSFWSLGKEKNIAADLG